MKKKETGTGEQTSFCNTFVKHSIIRFIFNPRYRETHRYTKEKRNRRERKKKNPNSNDEPPP
eukprot:m.13488 g.13488  ORF g.13488 m.13488 type:complete len:62 (-) comp7282_c0_seq1:1813-1998(-)